MPFASGVHVWIEVDGAPLPEYRTQIEQNRTTCFIPSQEGKRFRVRFQNTQPPVAALRGNVFLDGIGCASGLLLLTDLHPAVVSGRTRYQGLESPFQFTKLQTTDDEAEACQDEARLRELGTIRVQIEWVTVLAQDTWHQPSSIPSATNQPVHERSKKGSAHCASLGDVEVSRPKRWFTTQKLSFFDPLEFVFQYAPLDWLRAQDIVSDPSASSSSVKRSHSEDFDATSDDTVSEFLDDTEASTYRRLKAKMANGKQTKRRKAVKREPDAPSGSSNSQEVIDLTGDD